MVLLSRRSFASRRKDWSRSLRGTRFFLASRSTHVRVFPHPLRFILTFEDTAYDEHRNLFGAAVAYIQNSMLTRPLLMGLHQLYCCQVATQREWRLTEAKYLAVKNLSCNQYQKVLLHTSSVRNPPFFYNTGLGGVGVDVLF